MARAMIAAMAPTAIQMRLKYREVLLQLHPQPRQRRFRITTGTTAIKLAHRIHRAAQFEEPMTFLVVKIVKGDRLLLDQHRRFAVEKSFEPLNGINEGIEDDFCMGFLAKFLHLCAWK